jgi:uncharacterized integral membrane protein
MSRLDGDSPEQGEATTVALTRVLPSSAIYFRSKHTIRKVFSWIGTNQVRIGAVVNLLSKYLYVYQKLRTILSIGSPIEFRAMAI